MSSLSDIASVAAPIVGGIVGGPAGAAVGSGVAGILNQPDMPSSPDYTALAMQQYNNQLALNRSNTMANRPNQITPYGSLTWTQDKNNPDQWTSTTSFSPEQLALYNSQVANQQGALDLSGNLLSQAGNAVSTPYALPGTMPTFQANPNALPTYGDQKQATMDAMLSRVNDQYSRDVEAKKSQLAAQGIPVGSEAYQREMDTLNRQLTDARQQAELNATQMAGADYSSAIAGRQQYQNESLNNYNTAMRDYLQSITNYNTMRSQPINEYNSINTGSPVSNPTFSNFATATPTNAPDLTGAATNNYSNAINQYNAAMANTNNLVNAGSNIAGAYMQSHPQTKQPANTNTYTYSPSSYSGMGVMNPYNAANPNYGANMSNYGINMSNYGINIPRIQY